MEGLLLASAALGVPEPRMSLLVALVLSWCTCSRGGPERRAGLQEPAEGGRGRQMSVMPPPRPWPQPCSRSWHRDYSVLRGCLLPGEALWPAPWPSRRRGMTCQSLTALHCDPPASGPELQAQSCLNMRQEKRSIPGTEKKATGSYKQGLGGRGPGHCLVSPAATVADEPTSALGRWPWGP